MLIFLHGFPETAYLAWHRQIEYFSNMGYFVVAPDQRGYNERLKNIFFNFGNIILLIFI